MTQGRKPVSENESPYDKLTAAIKKRDRALTGIASWQKAREEAEAQIAEVTVLIAASVSPPPATPVAAPATPVAAPAAPAVEFQNPDSVA